ncbi:MAG: Rv3654c family TadE-like protein [Arachnia sp.]
MRQRDERGSGTMLTVGVIGAVMATAWAAAVVTASLGQAQRALGAADLAALAAASAYATGQAPCEAAAEAAERNAAELVACDLVGRPSSFVVEVTVAMPLPKQAWFAGTQVQRSSTAGTG